MKRLRFALALAFVAPGLSGAAFRFSQPIETLPGWSRLEIPDDVLDVCRPGLPDLRILDEDGKEVPYAFESQGERALVRLPLQDLESLAGRETTAVVDRGARPPLAESATLDIDGEDFLKPVVLEASDDRSAWKQIARASLFSTGGIRRATLRFPASGRRYLRFRLDDRNGPPVRLSAAWIGAAGSDSKYREIRLEVSPAAPSARGVSRFEASLPAANLGIAALRFAISEPAYRRRVRVFERVFFRDELSRRLVGEGTILRAPGSEGQNVLPVCELFGKNVDIEIEDSDSQPLTIAGLEGIAPPRILLFFAPENKRLTLEYGSAAARAPRYDFPRALAAGRPASARRATLDKQVDRRTEESVLRPPPAGQPVDSSGWSTRERIMLPQSGSVAYLDLDTVSPGSALSVRIVDRENRQVPYIVELEARQIRLPLQLRSSLSGTRTIASIEGIDPSRAIESIELFAEGPEYFARDTTVIEDEKDARGVTGQRVLGTARWERHPDEPPQPLRIAVLRPSQKSVRAEIENGDNAPIRVNRADAWVSTVRMDFVFSPGDDLYLLSGNPEARPPHYDLAMIAARVLESPARAARLSPLTVKPEEKKLPPWFWASTVAAVLLLMFGLARSLKNPSARQD